MTAYHITGTTSSGLTVNSGDTLTATGSGATQGIVSASVPSKSNIRIVRIMSSSVIR